MLDPVLTKLKSAVSEYRMPARAKEIVTKSDLVMVCGVTAAGKNTIVHHLIGHADYEYVVSHTTRPPRENHGKLEQNGVEYWFVDNREMLDLVTSQAFVEVKAVHGDTFYGTSIASIERAMKGGRHPVTEVDVQGALEFANAMPQLRPVFILPPSFDVWMERLGTRGVMTESERQRRLVSAKMELQTAIDNPSFSLVINRDIEPVVREIIDGIDTSADTQTKRRELAMNLLQQLP